MILLDQVDELLKMASIGHPFANDPKTRRKAQAKRDMSNLCNGISDLISDYLKGGW